jgi:hypothetical protein
VNIETTELIEKLRSEEELRHGEQLKIESDRHEREVALIFGLQQTIQRWENEGVPASDDPAPPAPSPIVQKRRPRGPYKPKVRASNIGTLAIKNRAPAVNCAAEFRSWIAKRGKESFIVDEVAAAVSTSTGLILQTVKARLFPFLQHLQETGQVDIEGDKRHRIYTATDAFKPITSRQADVLSGPSVVAGMSDRERKWREQKEALGLDKQGANA